MNCRLPIADCRFTPSHSADRKLCFGIKSEIGNRKSEIGFTLIEVLLAMFILGLGLVAIASVFPVAGYLQKKAYDDITTTQIEQNSQSTIRSRGFREVDLTSSRTIAVANGILTATDPYVFPLVPELLDIDLTIVPPLVATSIQWPLSMRSFPIDNYADGDAVPNEPDDPADPIDDWADDLEDPLYFRREFYLVPLARDVDPPNGNWRIYVFILRAQANAEYGYRGDFHNRFSRDNNGANIITLWANRGDGQEFPVEIPPPNPGNNTRWYVPGVRHFDAQHYTADPDNRTIEITEQRIASPDTHDIDEFLQIGDWILGSDGQTYRVVNIDPDNELLTVDATVPTTLTAIWFAIPQTMGQPSPTTKILTFSMDAVK